MDQLPQGPVASQEAVLAFVRREKPKYYSDAVNGQLAQIRTEVTQLRDLKSKGGEIAYIAGVVLSVVAGLGAIVMFSFRYNYLSEVALGRLMKLAKASAISLAASGVSFGIGALQNRSRMKSEKVNIEAKENELSAHITTAQDAIVEDLKAIGRALKQENSSLGGPLVRQDAYATFVYRIRRGIAYVFPTSDFHQKLRAISEVGQIRISGVLPKHSIVRS